MNDYNNFLAQEMGRQQASMAANPQYSMPQQGFQTGLGGQPQQGMGWGSPNFYRPIMPYGGGQMGNIQDMFGQMGGQGFQTGLGGQPQMGAQWQQGQQMPSQQPQQAPVDPSRYGLNDRQRQMMQQQRQAYQDRGSRGGIGQKEAQDLQAMKLNMQKRNAGMQVAKGQGRMGLVGRNEASAQAPAAKAMGGRAGRRGIAGSKPGRRAQARRNARR